MAACDSLVLHWDNTSSPPQQFCHLSATGLPHGPPCHHHLSRTCKLTCHWTYHITFRHFVMVNGWETLDSETMPTVWSPQLARSLTFHHFTKAIFWASLACKTTPDHDEPTHSLIHSFSTKPTYLGIRAYVGSTWSLAISSIALGFALACMGSIGRPTGTMHQKPSRIWHFGSVELYF